MTDFQAKARALAHAYTKRGRGRFSSLRAIEWSVWAQEDPVRGRPVVTLYGTVLKRYKDHAGKQMGKHVYVHRDYAMHVLPQDAVRAAGLGLLAQRPQFYHSFNCIRFDLEHNLVRFDEAPDFNSFTEPSVGDWKVVDPETGQVIKEGRSQFIWHHKWMWVAQDYTGFDVLASEAWSRTWLKKISNPSGSFDVWVTQLLTAGFLRSEK